MSTGNKQKKDLNQQQQRPPDSVVVVDDEAAAVAASRRASEINTAAAILSTQGPCRQVGDIYLACVATAGLGMCRSFRASFEQCAVATKIKSTEVLEQIGDQMFGDVTNNNSKDDDERVLQAARMINLQNLGLQPPSEDQN